MAIMGSLTSDLKVKIQHQLQKDSKKGFDSEFIRTTNLENKIVNEYGFDGIKLLFETQNSSNYYQLGDFPQDCPWIQLNNKTIIEFMVENFSSITKKIPSLLKSLKKRCKFIYAERKEETWYLHYLIDMKLDDERAYFKIFTGGEPLLNPIPNNNLKTYNWDVPNDLKTFYAIHNGFGEIQIPVSNYILPNEDIKVMAEIMDPICKEQNVKPTGYSFNHLLEFYPDGNANAQCFYKNKSTVDWDHEVWEISRKINFFKFINKRMNEIDEE